LQAVYAMPARKKRHLALQQRREAAEGRRKKGDGRPKKVQEENTVQPPPPVTQGQTPLAALPGQFKAVVS